MKAAIYAYCLFAGGLSASMIASAWMNYPEIQANTLHAENCWLWHSMSKKNYQVTMERLALRLGKDAK